MKFLAVTTLLLLSCLHVLAQSDCNTAVTAVEGTNSIPVTSETYYWYKYTVPSDFEDEKIVISSLSNTAVRVYENSCDFLFTIGEGSGEVAITDLDPNQEIFVRWSADGGDFDWQLQREPLSIGEACTFAVEATAGINAIPTENIGSYWLTYEMPSDFERRFYILSSLESVYIDIYSNNCNDLNSEGIGDNGRIFTSLNPGETIFIHIFNFLAETPFEIDIVTTSMEVGDNCEFAANASLGNNDVPSDIGTNHYWYTYDIPGDFTNEKLVVTSSVTNTVVIYSGDCSSLSFESSGNGNASATTLTAGETAFIRWSNFDGDDISWTLDRQPLDPGENCDFSANASLGNNDVPSGLSTDYYWYTYDIPGDFTNEKLVVTSSVTNSVRIYSGNCSSLFREADGSGNASTTAFTAGETVYIWWSTSDGDDFPWTLDRQPQDPGESCEISANASLGNNDVPSDINTDYWFTYDIPGDFTNEKLVVTSSVTNSVVIYSGDCSSLSYENGGSGNASATAFTAGETVYIRWSIFGGDDFSWTLDRQPLDPGERCDFSANASLGNNDVPSGLSTDYYWYTYDIPGDFTNEKLVVTSSVTNSVRIYSGDCSSLSTEANGNGNASAPALTAGETVIIRWSTFGGDDFSWTLDRQPFDPGESCETARDAILGVNEIPEVAVNYYWFSYVIPEEAVNNRISLNTSAETDIVIFKNNCESLEYEEGGYQTISLIEFNQGDVIFIRFDTRFDDAFNFNLTFEPLDQGILCSNPIPANLNTNTADFAPQWFIFTPDATDTYVISSVGFTTEDTYLRVYDACGGTQIAFNDDFGGLQSQLELELVAGEPIYILWDDNFSSSGFTWSITGTTNVDSQTITFNQLASKKYDDEPFNLNAIASSGLPVVYESDNPSVATIDGNTVTITGVGSVNITASQPGNEEYSTATPVVQELIVEKADQTISFDPLPTKSFEDADFNLNATASSDLEITYSSSNTSVATITDNTVSIVGAGTTEITAAQAGNENYNENSVNQILTIAKASQTISLTAPDRFIDEGPFDVNATVDSGLPLDYAILSGPALISGSTITLDGTVGFVELRVSQEGNENYQPAQRSVVFAVNDPAKTNQSITFNSIPDKNFDDSSFDLDVSASSGLSLVFESSDPDVATVSSSGRVSIEGTGTTIITASQPGNETYNPALPVEQELEVEKAEQEITFDPIPEKELKEGSFELNASASSRLTVSFSSSNEEVATVSGTTVTLVGVGTTTITASQNGNSNYRSATSVEQELNVIIIKQDQTITFTSIADKTYGDEDFQLSASASSGLPVNLSLSNENVISISGTTASIVGAGTVTITASQGGNEEFNVAPDVQRTLTVEKADQTIVFDDLAEKIYGDADFDLSATTSSGLEVSFASSDENVISITDNTVTIMGAGTATVTASQDGNENYNAAPSIEQNMIIAKADQVVTIESVDDKEVTDSPFVIEAETTSGLPLTFSVEGPASISDNILTLTGSEGTVIVNVSQPGSNNYNEADASISFEVIDNSPESQTISFESVADKTYGDESFGLTASSSSGLAVVFSSSDEEVITIEGATASIIGAGTATITASQEGDDTYAAAEPVEQEVVINKAEQVITFEAIEDQLLDDESMMLTVSVSSGLEPVLSILSGPATLSGNELNFNEVGTVEVEATQPGNENYLEAVPIVRSFDITVILATENSLKTLFYPNPVQQFIELRNINTDVNNISVVNSIGKIIKTVSVNSANQRIDLNDIEGGIYYLIFDDGKSKSIKFMKN